MTKELEARFAKVGSQEDVEDPIVVAKYFKPGPIMVLDNGCDKICHGVSPEIRRQIANANLFSSRRRFSGCHQRWQLLHV